MMFSFGRRMTGLALGVSLIGAGTAYAAVPQDALVVGGIEYAASEAYVRSVYGAPREVETKLDSIYSAGQATEWEYGNGFDIIFDDGAVRLLEIGAPNGIQTKAGIAVGTDVNTLLATYGQPDAVRGDDYIYYVEGDRTIGLVFEIENKRVDEIKMGLIR